MSSPRISRTLILVVVAWLGCLPRALADGDRDTGFGAAGERLIVRTHSTHSTQEALGDVAVLPDRRIYWAMADGGGGLWLGRLLADGDWDQTFGNQGLVELSQCVPSSPRRLRLAVDPASAVVLWTGRCLLRFHADGSPDPGFAATSAAPASSFEAAALLRDAAGRWLLAGTIGHQFAVWRFLVDGSNDMAFGNAGIATPPLPDASQRQLRALALRPDGRLLLAGWLFADFRTGVLLAQVDATGELDSGFGDQGVVRLPPPNGFSSISAEALALDRDGSAIVAGNGNNGAQSCCVLVTRLLPDGQTDPGFGLKLMQPPGNTSLSPFGETTSVLSLLPSRRILLARNAFPLPGPENTRTRFTLIRLQPDGGLDLEFGNLGWRTYHVQDPSGAGLGGPYSQLHGMVYSEARALMFGRTFFEDGGGSGQDFLTFLRVGFDALFVDGFQP